MPERIVVVKKYENRRLYDTAASRYVNLDDIARMVREGVEVQVVDARSGEDLTRVILTQVILEDAKGRESALPLDLLRKMIVTSDRAAHEVLAWYLSTVSDMYQKAQTAFEKRPLDMVRNLFASPSPAAEVEALRLRVQELEDRLRTEKRQAPVKRKPANKPAKQNKS